MAKTKNDNRKVTVKTGDAVSVYKIVTAKGFSIRSLKKEDMFAVLRAANSLKPVAESFQGFLKDAQERLKPEDFDALMEKAERFDTLAADEKREVNKAVQAYNKDVDDCVKTELEKDTEVEAFARLSEDAIAGIASSNDLDVAALMLLQDTVG